MAGIPTSNILQPGSISLQYANRPLIVDSQLLTPQSYSQYVQKYGNEEFFQWLATYSGMEEVKNRNFFWWENRGKLMIAVSNSADVTGVTNGASITVDISAASVYTGNTSPLRANETVRIASTNVEGVIISVTDYNTAVIRPKQAGQKLVSAGQASTLLAGEVLVFGGATDVGEASDSVSPLAHLDQKYENNITEIRDSWAASDLAEMTEVWYNGGVTGAEMAGGGQAGTSMFTYKGLVKTNQRFVNNIDAKLMFGDKQDNTGLLTTTSAGTQGFIPKIVADGETVTYTGGTLDIAKLHEITRIMDVNGCAKDNIWLQDVYQRQQFSDGIFKEFPAGAWVWGQNEKSEEANINYGVQSIMIDGYRFGVKKYKEFNTEVRTGVTPVTDAFRSYGIICPQGTTRDAKDSTKSYKNITVMYQTPPKGGTIGNGIRVWQHGGASVNATNGQMLDKIEMITYRGLRVTAASQFIQVASS
jgi:hypothetical protein